jgi:simple sugar transport system substrate-binding protein
MQINARKISLFGLGLLLSASSIAGSILENGPSVKKYFDANPANVTAAIRLTDPNTWARCVVVHVAMLSMEVRGQKWDDNTALTFALLGEAMGRVRGSFLSKGYPQASLDSLVKGYAARQVDVPEMRFCNELANQILAATPAAAPAAARSAEPASAGSGSKPAPLKIAFAYVGSVGDGGWTFAHETARKAVEKEFGDRVKTSFIENVPESADAERVMRNLAAQGNKLIFGTTFGYMEPMVKVARDFKDVKFEHATGYKQADNLRTYDSRTYEGAYLAGVIAGNMTKSNTLGVVASIPIPEVIRNINSFTLGAQSVNPKVKTRVVWVNGWFDPPKETEAATALMNGGADVLFQNTDSPAVLKAAEAKGKRALGWDSDMTAYGPKAHLGSSVINWGPYYIKAIKEALDGSWKGGGSAWWGVKEGAVDIVSIAADVPAETRAKVEQVKKGLTDGSFVIWKGPITDNTGKVQIAMDAVADDKFLDGLSFYVKGVEGKVPGSR